MERIDFNGKKLAGNHAHDTEEQYKDLHKKTIAFQSYLSGFREAEKNWKECKKHMQDQVDAYPLLPEEHEKYDKLLLAFAEYGFALGRIYYPSWPSKKDTGMFDTIKIIIECPHCFEESEMECQTKDFECLQQVFEKGSFTGDKNIQSVDSMTCCSICPNRGRYFIVKIFLREGVVTGEYIILNI